MNAIAPRLGPRASAVPPLLSTVPRTWDALLRALAEFAAAVGVDFETTDGDGRELGAEKSCHSAHRALKAAMVEDLRLYRVPGADRFNVHVRARWGELDTHYARLLPWPPRSRE